MAQNGSCLQGLVAKSGKWLDRPMANKERKGSSHKVNPIGSTT